MPQASVRCWGRKVWEPPTPRPSHHHVPCGHCQQDHCPTGSLTCRTGCLPRSLCRGSARCGGRRCPGCQRDGRRRVCQRWDKGTVSNEQLQSGNSPSSSEGISPSRPIPEGTRRPTDPRACTAPLGLTVPALPRKWPIRSWEEQSICPPTHSPSPPSLPASTHSPSCASFHPPVHLLTHPSTRPLTDYPATRAAVHATIRPGQTPAARPFWAASTHRAAALTCSLPR